MSDNDTDNTTNDTNVEAANEFHGASEEAIPPPVITDILVSSGQKFFI